MTRSVKSEKCLGWLDLTADPRVASMVRNAILHWDDERYTLHAWCVMPDHVHVVATIHERQSLGRIVHSWKSFTAKQVNTMLSRHGRLWQPDYFDRVVRRGVLERAIEYVEMNPVHAGLVVCPKDWPFSSAAGRVREDARVSGPAD